MTISGKVFNETYGNKEYIKFINRKNEKKYKTGYCSYKNGICFCDIDNIGNFIATKKATEWYKKVLIPDDAKVEIEKEKYKSDKLVLSETYFFDYDFYKLCVQQNGMALQFVPEKIKTYELCKISVQQNGYSLMYVPKKLKTEEICILAVKNEGFAISFVPNSLRTMEIYKTSVEQNGMVLFSISFPKKMRTYEICKHAVQQNGYMLKYISKKTITEELCKMAVNQYAYSIKYVPQKFKTIELYKIALKKNKNILFYLPSNVYKIAKEQNWILET